MTEIARRNDGGQLESYRPPTPDQVVELLQLAAAYDKRTFGFAEKAAWTSAATIGGWTLEEAAQAIQYLQATSTEYLTPAHITAHIQDRRRRERITGGTNPETGVKLPSHAEALKLWADEMRAAGANPTDNQTRQASALLAQLLDGAPDAGMILTAAVLAAREFSARIDWRLEKLAQSPTGSGRVDKAMGYLSPDDPSCSRFGGMPPIPLEYIPDYLLNVSFAVYQDDFPMNWREYDPLGDKAQRREETRRHINPGFQAFEPTPRDMPAWVTGFLQDPRERDWQGRLKEWNVKDAEDGEARWAEASAYTKEKSRVQEWFAADQHAWKRERLAIVRQWYADHPGKRPGPYDIDRVRAYEESL